MFTNNTRAYLAALGLIALLMLLLSLAGCGGGADYIDEPHNGSTQPVVCTTPAGVAIPGACV